MSTINNVFRYLTGLLFIVFGLNGFLGFLPPPEVPAEAGAYLGALAAAGYVFPLIKSIEIVSGILLILNRAVPFALVLLAPIVVNIVAFHLLLAPAGSLPGLMALGMGLSLAWQHRGAYRQLFASEQKRPSTASRKLTPATT